VDVSAPEWAQAQGSDLRNVDKRPFKKFVKAYGTEPATSKSLGGDRSLLQKRDVPGAGWPAPEVAQNINTTSDGKSWIDHRLRSLISSAFLKTLSDWLHTPPPKVKQVNPDFLEGAFSSMRGQRSGSEMQGMGRQ